MRNAKIESRLYNIKNKFETRFRFKMYGENGIKDAVILNYPTINTEEMSIEEFEEDYKDEFKHLIDMEKYKQRMCCNGEFSDLDDWRNISIPVDRTEDYIDFVIAGEYMYTDEYGYVIISNSISYHEIILDDGSSLVTTYRELGECSPGAFWDTICIVNKILENGEVVSDFNK